MPLLGQAAVVIWSEMADPAAHDDWHSHEHMPERVGIPGFLRARRLVATDGSEPRFLVIYEVRDAAVMVSSEYLERLNHPTPWSQRTMADNRALNRSLCHKVASVGRGVGASVLALPFTPPASGAAESMLRLASQTLPPLALQPGLTGAHLLLRDRATDRPQTEEERLRGRRDGSVDALLLVEAYESGVLAELAPRLAAELRASRAIPAQSHLYALAHLMGRDDEERSAP